MVSSPKWNNASKIFFVVAIAVWNLYRNNIMSSGAIMYLSSKRNEMNWNEKKISNNLEMEECEANMSYGEHTVSVHHYWCQWNFWWFIWSVIHSFVHTSIYIYSYACYSIREFYSKFMRRHYFFRYGFCFYVSICYVHPHWRYIVYMK